MKKKRLSRAQFNASGQMIAVRDGSRGMVPGGINAGKDKVYGAYLNALDPRDNPDLQLSLAASTDRRFVEFLERIRLRRYERVSLQTIAKACNIGLEEFQNWWQRESTQRAIAEAQRASPLVTRDMADTARSKQGPCEKCEGLGIITAPSFLDADTTPGYRCVAEATDDSSAIWVRTCPYCGGSKIETKPGDTHSQDRVLEMAGLIQKSKGPMVAINNYGGAAHASAVTDLDKDMAIDSTATDVE